MINTSPLKNESTGTVTIDAATAADIPELVQLLTSLFTLEHDFAPNAKRQHKGLELMIAQPLQRIVMVARVHNLVAGMATAQLVVSTAQGGLQRMG